MVARGLTGLGPNRQATKLDLHNFNQWVPFDLMPWEIRKITANSGHHLVMGSWHSLAPTLVSKMSGSPKRLLTEASRPIFRLKKQWAKGKDMFIGSP